MTNSMPFSLTNGNHDEMQVYLQHLPSQHMDPLWSQMDVMVPAHPNPVAKAHIWKYKDCLPHLETAARLVPEEKAERRVLMLVNPNLKAPYTTDTIYGGLQIVNPGETAPAHRHSAFACRFIIDGEGFTAVEGKRMPLVRGDVVITPVWHWHDHGNTSNAPVVWLDMLNLPLFCFLPVHSAEGFSSPRYPSKPCDPCEWRFPWEDMAKALDIPEKPHTKSPYLKSDGSALSTTLGMQAERLLPGAVAEAQDICSYIYHCFEGSGKTEIETPSGEKYTFDWVSRDTFAVPAWSKIKHINESKNEPAYLVAVHDWPLLESLKIHH